jgi:hypothetical protein
MGISFLKKKRFSPFERRFSYLLLCNFSDGTGWKILRGAWNLRGTRDTKIQVIEVSVSSLYYLFSVVEGTYTQLAQNIHNSCTRSHASKEENRTKNRSPSPTR